MVPPTFSMLPTIKFDEKITGPHTLVSILHVFCAGTSHLSRRKYPDTSVALVEAPDKLWICSTLLLQLTSLLLPMINHDLNQIWCRSPTRNTRRIQEPQDEQYRAKHEYKRSITREQRA